MPKSKDNLIFGELLISTDNVPTFDRAALEDLRAADPDGAEGLVAKLIAMFLNGTPNDLERIESYAIIPQMNDIAEYVHRMKSSAATLGLQRMVAVYRMFELGRFGPAEISEFTTALRQEFELARTELTQIL